MVDIVSYDGEDFKVVVASGEWRVGIVHYSQRFSDFKVLERHFLTDEVHVLLEGEAVLYVKDQEGQIHSYQMETGKVYNVHKNFWHHIVVSKDATVLVVENRDTSMDNSERIFF